MRPQTSALHLELMEHVPPPLVWSHLYRDGGLSAHDRKHILECEECIEMFVICMKSENFAEAMVSLRYPPQEW